MHTADHMGSGAAASPMYLVNLPLVLLSDVCSAGLLRDMVGEGGYLLA